MLNRKMDATPSFGVTMIFDVPSYTQLTLENKHILKRIWKFYKKRDKLSGLETLLNSIYDKVFAFSYFPSCEHKDHLFYKKIFGFISDCDKLFLTKGLKGK